MKKLIIGIVIGLLFGLFIYYGINMFSTREPISYDLASVTITNKSGQHIKNVLLRHKSGTLQSSQLGNNDELRFIFTNGASENSYNIVVTFDNDSTLTSKEVYFEYGYRGIETITNSKIVTTNNW